jgi:hypothetical protein
MYDFTSGRILQTFIKDLSGTRTLQMVLDNPLTRPNPTHDQTDTQTVKELEDQLQGRAHIARALAGDDVFVSKFMFPSSYHIKVIVRDGNAFWLSSGNLNNTNQPDLASPPATEDRDWHVIIQDAELAQTFSAFLNQDFLSASEYQIATTDNAAAGEIKGVSQQILTDPAGLQDALNMHSAANVTSRHRFRKNSHGRPISGSKTGLKPAHRTSCRSGQDNRSFSCGDGTLRRRIAFLTR